MPSHSDRHLLPYSPSQLFALVADIERYPQFLPWCRAARILSREGNAFLGELVISFRGLTESHVSRVTLNPPERNADGSGSIDVQMVRGPFDHLVNRWQFTPAQGGTQVDFFLDFRFRSKLLEMLIGGLFEKASRKMTGAFRDRAAALYGEAKAGLP